MVTRRTFLRYLFRNANTKEDVPSLLKKATNHSSHLALFTCNAFSTLCADMEMLVSSGATSFLFFDPSLCEFSLSVLYSFSSVSRENAPALITRLANLPILRIAALIKLAKVS